MAPFDSPAANTRLRSSPSAAAIASTTAARNVRSSGSPPAEAFYREFSERLQITFARYVGRSEDRSSSPNSFMRLASGPLAPTS
jgi:hypothetical protein